MLLTGSCMVVLSMIPSWMVPRPPGAAAQSSVQYAQMAWLMLVAIVAGPDIAAVTRLADVLVHPTRLGVAFEYLVSNGLPTPSQIQGAHLRPLDKHRLTADASVTHPRVARPTNVARSSMDHEGGHQLPRAATHSTRARS